MKILDNLKLLGTIGLIQSFVGMSIMCILLGQEAITNNLFKLFVLEFIITIIPVFIIPVGYVIFKGVKSMFSK